MNSIIPPLYFVASSPLSSPLSCQICSSSCIGYGFGMWHSLAFVYVPHDTGDQAILSEIFLLSAAASSRLVLIGISNSIDLTERTLPHLCRMVSLLLPGLSYGGWLCDRLRDMTIVLDGCRASTPPSFLFQHTAVQPCSRYWSSAWRCCRGLFWIRMRLSLPPERSGLFIFDPDGSCEGTE